MLPEFPLILTGDTIPEPDRDNDIRFISTIDGTCWTCLQKYSALKELFKKIESLESNISCLVYITKAIDYDYVSAPLELFQFFYPVYIDRYCDIYTLNDLDRNIDGFLLDEDNRLLWAGAIPHSPYEMKKFIRIIRKHSNVSRSHA